MTTIEVHTRHAGRVRGAPWDQVSSTPETVDLLCSLVLLLRPKVVVEAGTYLAHTALAIGHMCRSAHLPTHIWTADPLDRYANGLPHQAIGPIGLQDYVTYYEGPYEEMLEHYDLHNIGLAWLDASSLENPHLRLEHLEATLPRLAPKGLVVMDDLMNEWSDAATLRKRADFYLPFGRGLGFFTR